MDKASVLPRSMLRACVAALLCAALLAVSAANAQALPGRFWGVVPQGVLKLDHTQRLKRGGVDSIRLPVVWPIVQPQRNGSFDWGTIDPQVEDAARAGIEVLPFLAGAPDWAVRSVFVPGTGRSAKAPVRLPVRGAARGGWIRFVKAAVDRYGSNGSFWAENPTLPKRPLRIWQIWNEANFKYFVAKPNPGEYGKLVKISHSAIKAEDRSAKLILGGLFAHPKGGNTKGNKPHNWFATDFIDEMYRRTPGINSRFIGAALHPYTGRWQQLRPALQEFRDVLDEHGARGKGIWITEMGWSSGPPQSDGSNGFAKGPQGQVQQLKGAFSLLRNKQRQWNLKRVYWFSVDDAFGACNFCDGSGLFEGDFRPKRSWYAYVKFAGGRP